MFNLMRITLLTSQATQGYSESLADYKLESEVSSIFWS